MSSATISEKRPARIIVAIRTPAERAERVRAAARAKGITQTALWEQAAELWFAVHAVLPDGDGSSTPKCTKGGPQ